jgi:NADH dehydrogenase
VIGPALESGRARVIVIGAGFGGLSAARALRREPVELTVIDRRNHHLFQPLLYQVATAALSPGDIAYPIRSILSRQRNARVLLEEVCEVDVPNRRLRLSDGEIGYDFVIIATGARNAYFGHADWKGAAPGLKSLEDALEIRRRILIAFEEAEREDDPAHRRALLTFVIVGGGPTGVELAGAIAEISRRVLISDFRRIDPREARVLLLEAGPRVLPTFPASLSARAQVALHRLGATVRTSSPVRALGEGFVEVEGERVETATILWSAGVEATALLRSLNTPLDRAGRVVVGPDLSVPGHPEIFAIGDAVSFTDEDGKVLPGLAQVAIQQGRHAARNIARTLAGRKREPFRYRDPGKLATIGKAAAVADFGRIRLWGYPAWLTWCFVHILFLIGFRNRFLVFFEWVWSYFTDQRGARLITGTISEDRTAEPARADGGADGTRTRARPFGPRS